MTLTGKVVSLDSHRNFGFIRPNVGSENIYFKLNNVVNGKVAKNDLVSYELYNNNSNGKTYATKIQIQQINLNKNSQESNNTNDIFHINIHWNDAIIISDYPVSNRDNKIDDINTAVSITMNYPKKHISLFIGNIELNINNKLTTYIKLSNNIKIYVKFASIGIIPFIDHNNMIYMILPITYSTKKGDLIADVFRGNFSYNDKFVEALPGHTTIFRELKEESAEVIIINADKISQPLNSCDNIYGIKLTFNNTNCELDKIVNYFINNVNQMINSKDAKDFNSTLNEIVGIIIMPVSSLTSQKTVEVRQSKVFINQDSLLIPEKSKGTYLNNIIRFGANVLRISVTELSKNTSVTINLNGYCNNGMVGYTNDIENSPNENSESNFEISSHYYYDSDGFKIFSTDLGNKRDLIEKYRSIHQSIYPNDYKDGLILVDIDSLMEYYQSNDHE